MRFVDALLVCVLLALGVASLIVSLGVWYASGELSTFVAISALVAIGLLLSAYGIWRGRAWGYLVAVAISTLSLLGNLALGKPIAAILDASLTVLALYALLTKKKLQVAPATPATPPPTAPIAIAYAELERKRKYVRRRI